ncbi:unnamed protein product [Cylindrotheca closterium]|uniref:Uncharacterized protein n=1 Tax=Cylindrotheca closterium TaxID=2856 RepID=A0AAD2FMH0_9STRA|nr:unnamed protein product [Cylindrotheca closterium]
MFGPIFNLRMVGLCPCLESEENRAARKALDELNAICKVVDWHVRKKSGPRGFVQSLFRQKSNDDAPTPSQMEIVDGTKDEINNGSPFPELQIKPLASFEGESKKKKNSADIRLDIPLHHIHRIEDEAESTIVIITKDVHSMDENEATKEAARISLPSQDKRDSISLDLKVIVEWNKNRQPEIEEEFAADGLRQKAKKATHFARREIEMSKSKKSREKRKEMYLQGGGMKFTAMAMANREI